MPLDGRDTHHAYPWEKFAVTLKNSAKYIEENLPRDPARGSVAILSGADTRDTQTPSSKGLSEPNLPLDVMPESPRQQCDCRAAIGAGESAPAAGHR